MTKPSAAISVLLIAAVFLGSCSSSEGDPDVPPGGHAALLIGRTLTAVVEGVADERLADDEWAIEVTAVHYARPALYNDRGGQIDLLPIESPATVPVFVDVQLEQGSEYLFVASHVEVGGPTLKLSAHGIAEAGGHEMIQVFLPVPADLLLPGEPDSETSRIAAIVQLLEEAEARDRAGVPSGDEGPRHDRAMEVLTALGYFETSSGTDDFNPSLGMSIQAYLDVAPAQRQVVEFYEMPQEVVDALDLVSVPIIAAITHDLAADSWAIGVRTSIGTAGPYTVAPDTLGITFELAAPRAGALELVVWPAQPDNLADDLVPLAVGLDVPELQSALGDIVVPSTSGDILLIDIATASARWISPEEAAALTTSWGSADD